MHSVTDRRRDRQISDRETDGRQYDANYLPEPEPEPITDRLKTEGPDDTDKIE